ncbi:MAG: lipid-binding SYLF domain-containing protein [Chlorobi bacterium]|nr:lipid-binding SYLF domain-containing protein [Chlorobiota bacterium]
MKSFAFSILIFFIFSGLRPVAAQVSKSDYSVDIAKAEQTRKEFLKTDPGLRTFFDNSYGYAILPSIGKGGLIVGGAHGKGIVFKNGEPVGATEMTQLSIGGQIGGKSYAEIIFFKSKAEYEVFITGRYEVAVTLAAVALDYGVSNDLAYSDGVAIVTKDNGGLMAEATVGGQKFSYNPFK